jgi:plasmid stabilization system protein ParE
MAHRLSPEAEAELDEIWLYIARGTSSMDAADRFLETLTRRFFLLSQNPYIGRPRDQDLRPGIRSLPFGN